MPGTPGNENGKSFIFLWYLFRVKAGPWSEGKCKVTSLDRCTGMDARSLTPPDPLHRNSSFCLFIQDHYTLSEKV